MKLLFVLIAFFLPQKQEEKRTKFCQDVGKCRVCLIHTQVVWFGLVEDHYEIIRDCGSGLQTVYYWNTYN